MSMPGITIDKGTVHINTEQMLTNFLVRCTLDQNGQMMATQRSMLMAVRNKTLMKEFMCNNAKLNACKEVLSSYDRNHIVTRKGREIQNMKSTMAKLTNHTALTVFILNPAIQITKPFPIIPIIKVIQKQAIIRTFEMVNAN